ncbi:MAG TPA: DUF4112 domain-containing protein [Candidatus Limnocylindria bacterium]|nr:DUF4112 domain-containing protein [Candidatus Limnocylindria bacterium]
MDGRVRDPTDTPRSRELAEVEALAWLLDNSIAVPGTGGRRFGIDALIGFIPVAGDLASGLIGLFVVWRGARLGLPRIAVVRMLANAGIDILVGSIPVLGDAFDLWFKANTRNLAIMRRYLAQPSASTRDDWLMVGAFAGIVVAVVLGIGWLLASVVSFLLSPFG